jgi:small redox-active disulfide protein 2
LNPKSKSFPENRGRLPISGFSAYLLVDTLDRNREASPVFRKAAVSKESEITPIRVGGFVVGIIGLQAALEAAAQENLPSSHTTARHLIDRLRAQNYIPGEAEFDYRQALLREYMKFKGEPIRPPAPQGFEVKVLGPGCVNCERLEQLVRNVMAAEGIVGMLEHVRDPKEISAYGILATPGLVINGQLRCAGRMPSEKQLREWLLEASL